MKYLIPILIGGIIGYFTNWIAIKMMFRPYEEKYIFNKKLPFTPGMIPKERHRIAESVGKTVEEYLLTPEKIMEILLSEGTRVRLETFISKKLDILKKEDISLYEYLSKKNIEVDDLVDNLSTRSRDKLISLLRSDSSQLEVIKGLENLYDGFSLEFIDYLETNPHIFRLWIWDNKSQINEIIYAYLNDYKKQDKLLRDFIDEDRFLHYKKIILDNDDLIVANIRRIFEDRQVQILLRDFILDLVSNNVSRLITGLVGIDTIVDKIISYINNYIFSDDIYRMIDKLLYLGEDQIKNMEVKSVANFIESLFKEGLLDSTIYNENLLDRLGLEGSIIIGDKLKINRVNLINYSYEKILSHLDSQKGRQKIGSLISLLIYSLLDIRVSNVALSIGDESIDKIVESIYRLIDKIEKEKIIGLISMLNISKIVEDEINNFPIELGEEIILDIAGKELKAITNLGAFIGGVIGILSFLMQNA